MHHRPGIHLTQWPSRETLQKTMPFCFRVNYRPEVSGISNYLELFIEKLSITFISTGWGGCTSDKHIAEHSEFLKHS